MQKGKLVSEEKTIWHYSVSVYKLLLLFIVHGQFVKNDGKKRLKPGTSNQFMSRVEWAKWQHNEAVLRFV